MLVLKISTMMGGLSPEFSEFHFLFVNFTISCYVELPFWPQKVQKTQEIHKIKIFETPTQKVIFYKLI